MWWKDVWSHVQSKWEDLTATVPLMPEAGDPWHEGVENYCRKPLHAEPDTGQDKQTKPWCYHSSWIGDPFIDECDIPLCGK